MNDPTAASSAQTQVAETLAAYCKALAHPVRVQILKILLDRGECISGDISMGIDKAASTVSEHLRILKESGLVVGTIDGPRRCYCANGEALAHLQNMISLLGSVDSACCRPGDLSARHAEGVQAESEVHHGRV